ncbi:MAG: choice-of-anchor B family protein [Bacteroidota bacterium]
MKSIFTFFSLIISLSIFGQLNVSFVGQVEYPSESSDIWGYVAPDDTEYAIIGLECGVSIVSLADPANPVEVALLPGVCTTWRDIKTWGEHAYVTNEGGNGLMVIDLTDLPNSATAFDWTPNIPGLGTLSTIHNIYIDEFGYAYLAGANINNGGLLYIDVHTTPGQPEFAGAGPNIYSHDVYARDNVAYSSEIYEGSFALYDVTDKQNSILLGSQETTGEFTHNTWLSDDGTILYTTDEVADAPVGAYDISDPTDIQALDDFKPLETLGDGVIPHNVHVWQDWLIVSYYSDGCILVDGSNPDNLIEVGNFDTFLQGITGFNGAWGAYPYLPSGLILISDIQSGLFILQPNYVNACWLEGNVSDASSGMGIAGADIEILSTNVFDESALDGDFATGYAVSGTYEVAVSKGGYEPQTVTVELINGEITELNVELVPLIPIGMNGSVIDASSGNPIPNAQVRISNEDFDFDISTDASGTFQIVNFFEGEYEIAAGIWGYKTNLLTNAIDETNNTLTIELEEGYEDIFSLDLGWEFTVAPVQGTWEIAQPPIGITGGAPFFIAPNEDSGSDPGNACYVTGNTNAVETSLLIGGSTTLTSPVFDVSQMTYPSISYELWYISFNQVQQGPDATPMYVELSNGDTSMVVDSIQYLDLDVIEWEYHEIDIPEFMTPTANMTISFTASSSANFIVVAEGGVDHFRVFEGEPSSVITLNEQFEMNIAPNPSAFGFQLTYDIQVPVEQAQLEIFNQMGQLIEVRGVNNQQGIIEFGSAYDAGIYFVRLSNGIEVSSGMKIIKY